MNEGMGPTDVSDEDMEEGPAEKVRHGRKAPDGDEPEVEGSIVGSGDSGEARARNTMGHGERMAKGMHTMGDHEGGEPAQAFDAKGSLRKQHGKVHGEGKD